jgi:trk system potassium uptake protein TrkA
VDCAIVGIGHNFEANALTTVLLKSMRVERVISRAANEMQARILSRIGADGVVRPEDESAERWSRKLLTPYVIDHVSLAEGYALIQMPVPSGWERKTLSELELRKKHNVTVVAIKRLVESASASGADTFVERVVDLPQPTSTLEARDTLVLAGFEEDLQKLPR